MNLKTELDKKQQKKERDTDIVLSDVKLLLEGNQAQEKEILRNVGLDLHIGLGEQIMEKKLNIDKLTNEYKEFPVYSKENIDSLCEDYRLYLRPANQFIGKIPADIGPILLRMSKEHNLNLDAKSEMQKNRFFVMAPPKLFNDYKTIGDKVVEMNGVGKKAVKRKAEEMLTELNNIVAPDPALFYSPVNDPDNMIMVKAWGNDFNIFRKIWGTLTKTNILAIVATLILSLASVLVPLAMVLFLNSSDILYPSGLAVWSSPPEGVEGLSFMTKTLAIIGQGIFVILFIRNAIYAGAVWFSKEGKESFSNPFRFATAYNKFNSKPKK